MHAFRSPAGIVLAVCASLFALTLNAATTAADVNARDAAGNTPLHLAALRSDEAAVDALIARQADVNALNEAGATPLHYGTGSERIVKALLAAGAKVDVLSKQTYTPLMTAITRPRSIGVTRLLLEAGADVNILRQSRRRSETSPVAMALMGGDRDTIRLLIDRSAELSPPNGFTPLLTAAFLGDLETAKLLLDRGVDPNSAPSFAGHALNTAFYSGQAAVAKLLIERGADLTLRSPNGHGVPPMVWTAYNELGDDSLARLLLDRGADLNAANDYGETVHAWALKRGPDTPLVRFLNEKGAARAAAARERPIPQNAIPVDAAMRRAFIRDRVQRSIDVLQRGSTGFLENAFVREARCISCHQQTLPAVAFGWAQERGFRVNETELARQLHAQVAMLGPRAEVARQMHEPVPDAPVSLGFGFDGLDALRYARDDTTDAMVHYLLGIQRTNGWWPSFDRRPPMEDGPIVGTAWAVRAVQTYAPVGREREVADALKRARWWLSEQDARTHNERVFQLLGLAWAGERPPAMRYFVRRIVGAQRPDGGWEQLPGLGSDSWATGSALIALHKAGLAVSDPVFQRGVDYLLRTQFDDGSWWVRSRSWPFQPHFDGRFPHGKDQWISAGGTAWATMALLLTIEPSVPAARIPTANAILARFNAPAPTAPATAAAVASTATANTSRVNFARDIKPLIDRSCADCHAGEKKRGGFSMTSRETLLKGGASGEPAIVPGHSGNSQLLAYVAGKVEDLEMPPLDRREKYPGLTPAEIALLRTWIDDGANWE